MIKHFLFYSRFFKFFFVSLLLMVSHTFFAYNVYAEEQFTEEALAPSSEVFFIAPLLEVIGFSQSSIAYGAGLAIGSGSGSAIGIRFLYATDPESFIFMEILFFLRLYLQGSNHSTGPFVQFNGGPVLYALEKPELSGFGNFSAGFTAGWRFPFGELLFVEPAIRAGYPYILGGGVSAGVRY